MVRNAFIKKIKELSEKPVTQAVLLIVLITVVAALVVTYSEAGANTQFRGFWDGVWWVLVTISTVGYGDKAPITPLGRFVAIVIMLFGVALLSVITATFSSIFVTRKIKEGKGLQEIKSKGHILLCGWNTQAEGILTTFEKEKTSTPIVMINQLTEEEAADVITRFSNLKLRFVRGDFTRENILNRANTKFASSVIILPDISSGNMRPGDERTILATLSIKTINPKAKVYAHIMDRDNLSHLRKARADEVIVSDEHSGYLLANHVVAPGVPQFFKQLFSETAPFALKRRPVGSDWVGKTYAEFREDYQQKGEGILLGIGTMSEPFNLADLMSDDYSYLDEFIMRKFEEAGRGGNDNEEVKVLINPAGDTQLHQNDFYIALEKEIE